VSVALTKRVRTRRQRPAVKNEIPVAGFPSPPQKERLALIIFALCLALFSVRAVTSMVQESSTWDETHYFGMGKYLLQTGRWDAMGCILHPPLSYYLSSIPLLFFPTDPTVWKNDPSIRENQLYRAEANILRGQALLSSPENRGDRLLTLSRLMMVLVALLLGWYVFSWSYALYGSTGAIVAIVLYSFCPNVLAHARLITPDIVVTAFSFITLYHFWKMLKEERGSTALIAGIALGLALLSKFTAVLLIPVCIALALIWLFHYKLLPWRNYLIFGAVGFAVLLLGYRGDLEPYFSGIRFQQEHASQGQSSFLCGDYSQRGWWYYYTVAFFLKTPIAAILSLAAALVFYFKRVLKGAWITELFLLIPAVTIFVFFSTNPQAIGLRYLLPIYPFLFVFAAGGISCLLCKKNTAIFCGLLALWYIGASLYIQPHYLAYFNELTGGPDNGYKYLVDSNLDWGQDLKGLGRYMREHNIPKVCLSYFGSDLPERYGISYEWLPSFYLQNPAPGARQVTLHDWVAVSATNLQGVYFDNKDTYAMLRSKKPVAQIGYSIFVYDLKN
jgi:4-amino-4-deoxy-L-arabinose transferase-like glycosyltransferase